MTKAGHSLDFVTMSRQPLVGSTQNARDVICVWSLLIEEEVCELHLADHHDGRLEDGEEGVHEVVPLAEEAVKAEGEGDDEEDDDDGELEEGDEDVGEHDDVDAEEGEFPDVSVARWQSLIPSFPWIALGWRVEAKSKEWKGIKFCSVA